MSPPSSASSDDSPTTSGGDNNAFYHDDTEMLDYGDYSTNLGLPIADESSPDAVFFGGRSRQHNRSSRFTSAQASPEVFPHFTASFGRLKPNSSSPEFIPDGDSPGIGLEMRGLKLNSRFPSPVQNTVRLEDVMLPSEDPNINPPAFPTTGSLLENKPDVRHVEHGLFQSYSPLIDK
jgi:hypothetical protein